MVRKARIGLVKAVGSVKVEKTLLVDVRYEPEDGIFIGEVRDLQGCWASGADHESLNIALQAAIADYYEMFEDCEVLAVTVGPSLPDEGAAAGLSHSEVKVLAGAC